MHRLLAKYSAIYQQLILVFASVCLQIISMGIQRSIFTCLHQVTHVS